MAGRETNRQNLGSKTNKKEKRTRETEKEMPGASQQASWLLPGKTQKKQEEVGLIERRGKKSQGKM